MPQRGSNPDRARSAANYDPMHRKIVPPRQGRDAARLDAEDLAALRKSNSSDVSDAVGRLYTMDGGIRPLYEGAGSSTLVGTALTVKAVPGDNWAILGAMGRAQAGDVLVVDWHGYEGGCGSGADSLRDPITRGLAGVVIDGCWRDIDEVATMGFPIFGRGLSSFSPAKVELGEINVPVSCGGVVVESGDVVVADPDGVAIVPRAYVAAVLDSIRGDLTESTGPSHSERAALRASRFAAQFDDAAGVWID